MMGNMTHLCRLTWNNPEQHFMYQKINLRGRKLRLFCLCQVCGENFKGAIPASHRHRKIPDEHAWCHILPTFHLPVNDPGCEFSTGPGSNTSGNLVGPVKILV